METFNNWFGLVKLVCGIAPPQKKPLPVQSPCPVPAPVKDVPKGRPSIEPAQMRSLAWCGEITSENKSDVKDMTIQYLASFAKGGAALVLIDASRLRDIDAAGVLLMKDILEWGRTNQVCIMFVSIQQSVRDQLEADRASDFVLSGAQ